VSGSAHAVHAKHEFNRRYLSSFLFELAGLGLLFVFWLVGAGVATVSITSLLLKYLLNHPTPNLVVLGKFGILPQVPALSIAHRFGRILLDGMHRDFLPHFYECTICYLQQCIPRTTPWALGLKREPLPR
jgi:hypothetical protein